jgi:hypothetical protein
LHKFKIGHRIVTICPHPAGLNLAQSYSESENRAQRLNRTLARQYAKGRGARKITTAPTMQMEAPVTSQRSGRCSSTIQSHKIDATQKAARLNAPAALRVAAPF